MSITKQNLTAIIVTFKSENVIHNCIRSIDSEIQILVVDNSNNIKFKENLEKEYKNVKCLLSSENLGMGAGNNLGLKYVKTDFAFILNPDVILENDTIKELIEKSKDLQSFGIIAPIEINQNFPNFKRDKTSSNNFELLTPFTVKSVDGYAMVLNLKKLNQIDKFYYFDENFFMYLENDDLCKRLKDNNEKIYIIPSSRIKHLGGKAVDETYKYEIELSRNWHWIWSKFYFNKKHHSYFFALINGFLLVFVFSYYIYRRHFDLHWRVQWVVTSVFSERLKTRQAAADDPRQAAGCF